ncbi:MAG: hypothetical protein R2941_13170 [Desulfobacterales bacterium]
MKQTEFSASPSYFPVIFFFTTRIWPHLDMIHFLEKMLRNCFWRSYAIRAWAAEILLSEYAVYPGHYLIKEKAIEKAGYLFDQIFCFLYFEDTDLFLRLRKKRIPAYGGTGNENLIHYYDQ